MRARLARRPNVTAAAIFAVLAVLFVSPGVMPGHTLSNSDWFWFKAPWNGVRPASITHAGNPTFDDTPAVIQPFTRYTKASLPHIPLWNPHIMTGRPFLADAQSAIFSPFNVPSYVLPYWTSLGWVAALKLWTAAFGMFLLARALAMRFAGAMLAGVVYGFSLWEVVWVSFPHASVWALIPWMMVAAERAIRRPTVRGAAPLAVVVGLQFLCGHPESSFHAVIATGVYFVVRMIALRPAWRAPTIAFAAAMALGTALAAVALLPFAELLLRSADIHQRAGSAAQAGSTPTLLMEWLLPDWFGRPTDVQVDATLELGRAWYAGALSLMLASAALILRPSRGRILLAVLAAAIVMVVVAIGPVFTIVAHLPVFSSGHNARLVILAILCIALLAGYGLDDVLSGVGSRRRRLVALGTAGAIFVAPFAYTILRGRSTWDAVGHGLAMAWGWVHHNPNWPDITAIVRAEALWIWLVVAGGGLAIIAVATFRSSRARTGVLAILAVGLVYGDLARAGVGYNPAIPISSATQPATTGIDLLKTAGAARVVATGDIPQNVLGMNYGLYESRGYDLPIDSRFDHLWRTTLSPEYPSQAVPKLGAIPLSLPRVTPDRLRVLGMMGTRYVVQPPTDPRLRSPGLTLVHNGRDMRVYKLAAEQPRAAVVGAQTVAPSGDAAYRDITAPNFRIDRVAVTEKPVAGLPTTTPARTPPPAGRARIAKVTDDGLVVQARAQRPGMLVVSDAWAPGWQATVDGHSTPVQRVDYVFRGVQLPAGNHRIVFSYHPTSFTIGWIISLLALAGLLAALGVSVYYGRRSSQPT